jgi:hypothetical protein
MGDQSFYKSDMKYWDNYRFTGQRWQDALWKTLPFYIPG